MNGDSGWREQEALRALNLAALLAILGHRKAKVAELVDALDSKSSPAHTG